MCELFDNAIINAFVKNEVAFGGYILRSCKRFSQLFLGRILEHNLPVVQRLKGGIGVHVDRGVEDSAAIDIGKG